MNYKKIIKNKNTRLKILNFLSFIPDKLMLKIQYRIKTKRKLNLKNPQRFTEKIQWYKLNYKNPQLIKCSDKYDVREYVKSKGLSNILIPCYGVYDSPEDINWDNLPNSFVMKDTLGGGGFDVIVVKNKRNTDIPSLISKLNNWVNRPYNKKSGGREWPYYSGKKHRIIIEKYLNAEDNDGGLIDYKFFCFQGKAKYLRLTGERIVGQTEKVATFDMNFNRLNVRRSDLQPLSVHVDKPKKFNKLISVAEKLSEEFPHVRIDLYYYNDKVYFGEMTFYGTSGYINYIPDEFDYILGKNFNLNKY